MAVTYTVSGASFSADKPRLWSSQVVSEYGIAPDGKTAAAIISPVEGAGKSTSVEAVFVFNFLDEVRRRVAPGK
jgi:hypothetical protein